MLHVGVAAYDSFEMIFACKVAKRVSGGVLVSIDPQESESDREPRVWGREERTMMCSAKTEPTNATDSTITTSGSLSLVLALSLSSKRTLLLAIPLPPVVSHRATAIAASRQRKETSPRICRGRRRDANAHFQTRCVVRVQAQHRRVRSTGTCGTRTQRSHRCLFCRLIFGGATPDHGPYAARWRWGCRS